VCFPADASPALLLRRAVRVEVGRERDAALAIVDATREEVEQVRARQRARALLPRTFPPHARNACHQS
jgi:hypothetical protein